MAEVLAVGFFDGVHVGHRRILAGATSALTFKNHPSSVLLPGETPPLLMSFGDRIASIRECGVSYVIALDFTRELADISPAEFARRLKGLAVSKIRCGANWRFGRGGEGDAEFLREAGFDVEVVPFAMYKGDPVSSTRIRNAIAAGEIEDANAMLGSPWRVVGRVEPGKGFGRKIGWPTVNLHLEDFLPRLPFGVYEVESCGERAVANWGLAPTMGERAWKAPVLELHFKNAAPQSDDVLMPVSFIRRLRPEIKFDSLDALRAQIAADCAAVFGPSL